MLKNLFLVSIRNLRRNKGYTLLNILGLTVAITVSILTIIKVDTEFSFEKDYTDFKRIYRINQDLYISDQHIEAAVTPGAIAQAIVETFPEVELSVRLERGNATLRHGDKDFDIDNLVLADSTVFSMFGIELVNQDKPNPTAALNTIAISQALAQRIFGNANPLGQILITGGTNSTIITAVFANLPEKSHLKVDAVIDLAKHSQSGSVTSWYDSGLFTYIKISEHADVKKLEEKLNEFVREKTAEIREKTGWRSEFSLMPITSIRLHSHRIGDSGGGSFGHIIALLAVTLIVVTLAAVNYTNMSVALANRRAHEVGMRKIVGSPRTIIIGQFLCESAILSIFAFLLALPLTEVCLSPFAELTGMPLSYGVLSNISITLSFLGFAIALGILSGFYPAFVLSSFDPLKVIRKGSSKQRSRTLLRNFLIVTQFAASLALIIVTIVVYQQREFLAKQSMGIDKENTIVLSTRNIDKASSLEPIKNEIKAINGVLAVALTASNPPQDFSASNFIPEDSPEDGTILITQIIGDSDFINSLGIPLIEGRQFDSALPADSLAVIVNQTLARRMGWNDPIGKRVWKSKEMEPYRVIGVVADFHFESMHTPIKPLVILLNSQGARNIIVRLKPENKPETIAAIKAAWGEMYQGQEITFAYVSDNYNKLYQSEEGMSKGFILLTIIAIFIACLGLVGLAAYSTNLRIKEIGIRKVMGASTSTLLIMLWWSFIKLIGIATLIAWPVSYYLSKDWLNNFAYRVELSPWVFIITAVMGIVLAILSVGSITYQAAGQNPSESIKYE